MSFSECIRVCNNASLDGYVRWFVGGKPYGWVGGAFARQLQRFPAVFQLETDGLHLNPALQDFDGRTLAVGGVLRQLHQEGVIDTWVGEPYPVLDTFGDPPQLYIERAAAQFLGVKSFGVHVNGLVQKASGLHVWVGIRSRDKPFWPGKFDQMVAGGQPAGISLLDNVVKEAEEEANVPAPLAATAQAVGQIRYRHQGWRGLEDSTLFVYDLWLPEQFVPENTDGEVEGFELLSLGQVAELTLRVDAFKANCNLVNIDLLLRQGVIGHQHPEYAALCEGLYQN